MARLVASALLLLLLAWPQPAAAQAIEPPVPPPPAPVSMTELPDLLAPVRFLVPQCDDCNGPAYNVGLDAKPAPVVTWTDPASPFTWLAWAIEDIMRRVICWVLYGLQALANVLQIFANALISAINQGWRFLIFAWLTLRSWLYVLWYLVELGRDTWRILEGFIVTAGVWLQLLGELLLRVLALAGDMAMLLVVLALQVVGLLGWVGGLSLGFIVSISAALNGATPPPQLAPAQHNSPVYQLMRGFGEGFRDSQLGWLLYLVWSMAYVAFFVWLARFLPGQSGEVS